MTRGSTEEKSSAVKSKSNKAVEQARPKLGHWARRVKWTFAVLLVLSVSGLVASSYWLNQPIAWPFKHSSTEVSTEERLERLERQLEGVSEQALAERLASSVTEQSAIWETQLREARAQLSELEERLSQLSQQTRSQVQTNGVTIEELSTAVRAMSLDQAKIRETLGQLQSEWVVWQMREPVMGGDEDGRWAEQTTLIELYFQLSEVRSSISRGERELALMQTAEAHRLAAQTQGPIFERLVSLLEIERAELQAWSPIPWDEYAHRLRQARMQFIDTMADGLGVTQLTSSSDSESQSHWWTDLTSVFNKVAKVRPRGDGLVQARDQSMRSFLVLQHLLMLELRILSEDIQSTRDQATELKVFLQQEELSEASVEVTDLLTELESLEEGLAPSLSGTFNELEIMLGRP